MARSIGSEAGWRAHAGHRTRFAGRGRTHHPAPPDPGRRRRGRDGRRRGRCRERQTRDFAPRSGGGTARGFGKPVRGDACVEVGGTGASPASHTSPPHRTGGSAKPAIRFSNVVFPDPLGPITASTSAGPMVALIPLKSACEGACALRLINSSDMGGESSSVAMGKVRNGERGKEEQQRPERLRQGKLRRLCVGCPRWPLRRLRR